MRGDVKIKEERRKELDMKFNSPKLEIIMCLIKFKCNINTVKHNEE